MTRAEAKRFNWFTTDRDGIEKHIDRIYDELEKANCKTCKWLNDEVCTNGDSPMCADYPNINMMCGYYEKR